MRRVITGLMACAGIAGALYLAPALAAETDERLEALSAEVKALTEGQAVMQKQLQSVTDWLAGAPLRAPAAAAAAPSAPALAAGDANSAALMTELEALRKTVAGYKEREEKGRLARLPVRDSDFTLQVADDPFKGSADAEVVLIEFTDYQCPFCSRHNKDTMPELLKNYVETGKVRYVMRDYPLAFHKNAAKAHEAAHCAGDQGKYWEMHDELFANQRALTVDKLPGYAEAVGVADMVTFQSCLDDDQHAERGQQSLAEGVKAGVSGTPSFLLGVMEADGSTVKATKFIRGAQTVKVFEDALEEILSAPKG